MIHEQTKIFVNNDNLFNVNIMARESANRTNVENLRLPVTEFYETLLENSFNVT